MPAKMPARGTATRRPTPVAAIPPMTVPAAVVAPKTPVATIPPTTPELIAVEAQKAFDSSSPLSEIVAPTLTSFSP